jgi:membrane dipeptidase
VVLPDDHLDGISRKAMSAPGKSTEQRINQLHADGIVDLHFDMPMDLYEKRNRMNVLATDFLPELETSNISLLGVAIYIEDRYLPEMGLRVALDQISRLYTEAEGSGRFAICKSYENILNARKARKIALLITMEGVEPLGTDLELLRSFYELGVRAIGLTHARRNAAGAGGLFASSGSSPDGLTAFGRDVVQQCEALGVIVDLAHISPAGFEDILAITTKPPIVSHTNARKYYDIERNISDEQIQMIGERRGVIGVNAVLVSPKKEESTLDRYIDHIEHIKNLIGIDGVAAKFTTPHFIPDLSNHSHARNLTRRLIERGFSDMEIEKILRGNWMRIFREIL